ncbi:hypothetical protein [Streptomyces sp. TLI_171]|uniref:hypothetical protein n=1 Tax=Streptomyces sp. TLI_171 TaxID=1938859 RepID=UPI000C182C80|nr:hypothetical protein [Streptomyces sp. TLI_171]RKE22057.1 hypothetical protein BX266_5469 [Streptomyces sp. TLI_171]
MDNHALRCFERGDDEHVRSIRLHPVHPDQNLALYIGRIEAAGWHLEEQSFDVDEHYRRCRMRFVRPAD